MSHSLPHLTLTTSTSSLSLSSPIFPTVSPTQDLWYTIHTYPAKFHARVADPHKSHLSQIVSQKTIETEAIEPEDLEPRRIELDRNLGTDPHQIRERFMRNHYQNPITEDMDEFGKVGAETSYIQSQTHCDYDSAESIADSDLEDGELRKCWLHRCIYRSERRL